MMCAFKVFFKKSQRLQSMKFAIVCLGSSLKSDRPTDVAFLIGIHTKQGWTTTTRYAVKKKGEKRLKI